MGPRARLRKRPQVDGLTYRPRQRQPVSGPQPATAVAGYVLGNVPSEVQWLLSSWDTAAREGTLIAIAHGSEAARTDRADPSLPPTFLTSV